VLGNVAVIEVCDAKVKQYVKEKREVEHHKIEPVFLQPYSILDRSVDTQYPERFNKQVQGKKKNKVGNKFPLHLFQFKGIKAGSFMTVPQREKSINLYKIIIKTTALRFYDN